MSKVTQYNLNIRFTHDKLAKIDEMVDGFLSKNRDYSRESNGLIRIKNDSLLSSLRLYVDAADGKVRVIYLCDVQALHSCSVHENYEQMRVEYDIKDNQMDSWKEVKSAVDRYVVDLQK